jgi:hypothetical protein
MFSWDLVSEAQFHEELWREEKIAPIFLTLTLHEENCQLQHCPFTFGKDYPYQLFWRLGNPQRRPGHNGVQKNSDSSALQPVSTLYKD